MFSLEWNAEGWTGEDREKVERKARLKTKAVKLFNYVNRFTSLNQLKAFILHNK